MTKTDGKPILRECLAYEVLSDRWRWLGQPTMNGLRALLDGARERALLTGRAVPAWRLFGPLENPEFYIPIVARTGHPTLSIKWATALEFLYFSLDDAANALLDEMRRFVGRHGFDTTQASSRTRASYTLDGLLAAIAHRPAMYLGTDSGWVLRCYLAGMDEGGDWLKLPRLPGLRRVIRDIGRSSRKSYGSDFAAYRMYDATTLLAWAGIQPRALEWSEIAPGEPVGIGVLFEMAIDNQQFVRIYLMTPPQRQDSEWQVRTLEVPVQTFSDFDSLFLFIKNWCDDEQRRDVVNRVPFDEARIRAWRSDWETFCKVRGLHSDH